MYGYVQLFTGTGIPATVTTATVHTTSSIGTPAVTANNGAYTAPQTVHSTSSVGVPAVVARTTVTTFTAHTSVRIGTPTVTATAVTRFSPPARKRKYSSGDRLFDRLHWDEGQTVLSKDGFFQTVSNPTAQQLTSADRVYLGGRTYHVTSAEAQALAAAGYTAYLLP